MKKIVTALIIFSMLMMAACASSNTDASTPGTSASSATVETEVATLTTEPEANAETTAPAALSADELYNAYLTKLCDKLSNIIVDDTHLDGFAEQEGMLGISEFAISGDVEMLKKMGYLIQDLNGDETAELIIYQVDQPGSEPCTGIRILCAYTATNGDMALIFEGNSKNRFYLLNDGTILNECSESTARLGFGIYQLNADGTALECLEFNFIDYLDEKTANCYRNQSGQFDIENSELTEGGKEAYEEKKNECLKQIKSVELTAFEAFAG